MAVTEESFRKYLGPMPDDTTDLKMYLEAAKAKARSAGIPDFKNNAYYDLFICALAAMFYENRGMTFSGSYQATASDNAQKLINTFVLELRGAKDEPEGGAAL